jgi:hypothetical protein
VLDGFAGTDILAFGGTLQRVNAQPGAVTVATFVPAFPIYPPEFSWMREPATDIPAIVAQERPEGGRTLYLAADIDRVYGARRLPDHGRLLANCVRWATDELPLRVEGPGYLSCHLYRQEGRLLLHILNLSGANEWPAYVEEHLPVGPLRVGVRWDGADRARASLRVAGGACDCAVAEGWAWIELERVMDHELMVFEGMGGE